MSLFSDDFPETDMVAIRSCGDTAEAALLRSVLSDAGIRCHIQGEHHRALVGILTAVELRLLVAERDVERAKAILAHADEAVAGTGGSQDPVVFRVRAKRRRQNPIPTLLGIFVAGYLLSVGQWILGAIMGTASVLIAMGNHFSYRGPLGCCSTPSCQTVIPHDAATCPGCGHKVAGEIEHQNERLRALEALHSSESPSRSAEPGT